MADFIQKPEVVCPACQEKQFDIKQTGFISKKQVLTCLHCGLSMETNNSQNNFVVLSVGENFQNAKTLLQGKMFTIASLRNHGLMVIPDTDLGQLSQGKGEIFDYILNHEIEVNIVKKKNEIFFIDIGNVVLKEERSKRVSTPVAGVGFRITKGVYYRIGNVGQSQYASTLTFIDSGNLIVSNQRYVFVGSKQTIDQPFSKITAITPYTDGLSVARSNKQKIEYYVGTGPHWPFIYGVISGLITNYNG